MDVLTKIIPKTPSTHLVKAAPGHLVAEFAMGCGKPSMLLLLR